MRSAGFGLSFGGFSLLLYVNAVYWLAWFDNPDHTQAVLALPEYTALIYLGTVAVILFGLTLYLLSLRRDE